MNMSHNRDRTHCRRGHEFTTENTYTFHVGGSPRRVCRACDRTRRQRHRTEGRYKTAEIKARRAACQKAYYQTTEGKEKRRMIKARIKERYHKDVEYQSKILEGQRVRYRANPEPYRARGRANNDNLVDTVIRRRLSRYYGGKVLCDELKKPENRWLIDLERARLKLKRLLQ